MPPRPNRKQRKNEIKFQVVRDENNEVVFRMLNAPRGVKTRNDLSKHLPADFPMDMIEEANGGRVQTRYSREGGDGDDPDDLALAERLLKGMTLHDIGFDDTHDGEEDEIDFDNVDEIIEMADLQSEFGSSGRKSRNDRLRDAASGGDYAYDYNKHFKPMTPGVAFYLPGQGMTADPEAHNPIVPAAPAIDVEYEEDLKSDVFLKERGEKIQAKIKKTIHSKVSGLDVPVFESSRYKFTDDFLHPLIDGDTEGYEELEDNIFELLLQSDDEGDKTLDPDAFSDNDDDDFAMLTREEIIAKMRQPSSQTTEELFPEFAAASKKGKKGTFDEDDDFVPKMMSLADFGYGSDEEVAEAKPTTKKSADSKKTPAKLNKSALAGLKKAVKANAAATTTTTITTTTTTTTTSPPPESAESKPTTTKTSTKKSAVAKKGGKKGVSFSTKSVLSDGATKKKTATTKGATKFGSDLGGYDDAYGDEAEEVDDFNPDDMFGFGDDDDHTTSRYDDDFPTMGSKNDDQDFGYDDGDDLNAFGNDNDIDEDYEYQDEDEYDDEDQEDDDIDLQIQEKMKSRILSQFSKSDGVEVDIEDLDEDDDIDYGFGEGEHYDPFGGEGEFDFDGDGAVMSDYLRSMMGGGSSDGEYDDEDYYDEDDEDAEGYGYGPREKERRGQNRDQDLSIIPASDPLMEEHEYAQFQRLVNVYEQDNSTDDDEYDDGEYYDEDDEQYMFHINRQGIALNDSEVKKAMLDYNTQKAKTQKHYQNLRKTLSKDVKEFIRHAVQNDQATPQGNIDQVSKEIDRAFAKKKQSRLDVQSMRTTLSTTANVPTLIKEARIKAAKRQPGTTLKTTQIVTQANAATVVEVDYASGSGTSITGSKKKSVSFGEDIIQDAPRQIKLDHKGIPIGVLEKHRQERNIQEEKERAAATAAAAASSSNNSSRDSIEIIGTTPKPRIQLNFTQPVSVAFAGQTKQFPTTTAEDKANDGADIDDDEDCEEDQDEDFEDDDNSAFIPGMRRDKKETPEERKLRKKLQKEYNSSRRAEKKNTKNMYKEESRKAKHQEQVLKFKNPAFKKML